MKYTVQHEIYGQITCEESFWSGKKTVSINGTELDRINKKTFIYETDGNSMQIALRGDSVFGIKLLIGDETLALAPAPTWYEIVCSLVLAVLIMMWGNTAYLCSIVPIVGGAIGGAVCGLMAFVNLIAMKSIKNIWAKIAVWVAMVAATFVLCYVLALVIAFVMLLISL